jgi:hypothetical protein
MKQGFALPVCVLSALLIISAATSANAAVPGTINYQGRLTNPAGVNVPDGNYSVRFTLYDAASAGTSIWAETLSVAVSSGLFSVGLGNVHAITATLFSSPDRWLGIAVAADPELTPRTKFATVAYAFAVDPAGGAFLPLAGGTMTGPITSTGEPAITMGKGNFGGSNVNSGSSAFVAGSFNSATGNLSSVAGGQANHADDYYTFIGGGYNNGAVGRYAAICGGRSNAAGHTANDEASFVGGGYDNQGWSKYSAVAGGYSNIAQGVSSFIGGGDGNWTFDSSGTISGGYRNWLLGKFGAIGGGQYDTLAGVWSTISGGFDNKAGLELADTAISIGGGSSNVASAPNSTIAGGLRNTASGLQCTIAGGRDNVASGMQAVIGGGERDTASNQWTTVAGGAHNVANGFASMVPGGSDNIAGGNRSFAAGLGAHATHDGSFIWADDTPASYLSDRARQTKFRAGGGVKFDINQSSWIDLYSDGLGRLITVSNGAYLSFGGTWTNSSSRTLKENFQPVDGRRILEKLEEMPILEWNYKAEPQSTRHIGPTAQDFYSAFGLGGDTLSISTVDPSGIALAAVKELNNQNKELRTQNAELRKQLDELARKVEKLTSGK